ncbi:polyphenol oxidase family protein [Candidatus Saccharibacteria bacterium]|nr:polyphenol oxidase family protein [Candidatus Saccharibacteria bacterium]
MIAKDQPTMFVDNLVTGLSSASDGNLKYINDNADDNRKVDQNRADFLQKVGIRPDQTVLIKTTYDGDDYTRYKIATKENCGQGITKPIDFNTDSMATNEPNVAIFLPVADCIAGFVYDPTNKAFMVVHLGRQHTEQYGASKSIEFMVEKFGSNPGELTIWLGPAPSKDTYPLFSFDNRSLHDVNLEHLINAGVNPKNVTISDIDPAVDKNYFSHSEFLKGHRDVDGRFAVVAMLK